MGLKKINFSNFYNLISDRADVSKPDQFIWTPLHHAACAGHVEIVELLLEAGAAVDALALNEATPLMRAIQSSRPSCVDVLLKAGADVNVVNKTGLTINLENNGEGIIEFNLIHRLNRVGVTCHVLNVAAFFPSGQTCMDIAKSYADARVIELIQEKMELSPPSCGLLGKMDEAKKDKPANKKVPK